MNKITLIIALLISSTVWACPNCAGSANASDKYTVYVLAAFIVFTYIPFYIIFKTASKTGKKSE